MKRILKIIILSLLVCILFSWPAFNQSADKSTPENADQIHFSIINSTSVTFDWVGSARYIRLGLNPNHLTKKVKASDSRFLPVTSPWKSAPGPYREAKVTRLKQNTTYYYSVGKGTVINKFKTPLLPGNSGFRVCLTSDIHETSKECIAMFNQIAGLKPDIVITTGDITGAGPDGQQEVSNRFHDAMAWSLNAAWMPAWGNHDWEYTNIDDLRTLKGRFDIPNPGTISGSPAISCCGEDWGWFDYGNARFISYPEPWTPESWKEWTNQVTDVFESAEKNSKIKFVITFGHRSAYTSTSRRSPGDMHLRNILDSLHASFPKYKLDLSGHNHQYERYNLQTAMTYVVNSSTGSYYHEGWDKPIKPVDCSFRAIHYGILVLDFNDDTIECRFICSENSTQPGPDYMPLEENICDHPGTIIDSFTIQNK